MCSFITLILFADELKIYRAVTLVVDWRRLQSDINDIKEGRFEEYIKLNKKEYNIISFFRDTDSVRFNSHIGDILKCIRTV
jgi:hypothetical protein